MQPEADRSYEPLPLRNHRCSDARFALIRDHLKSALDEEVVAQWAEAEDE